MKTPSDSDPDLYEDDIPDASELLDFELIAKSQPEKGQGLWLWVVLILILAGGGWAGWMYLQDEAQQLASTDGVPLIMSPKFDLKEKPADPGGMKVPDRDKLVYGRMAGEGSTAGQGVERLLPPPETPIEPPKTVTPMGIDEPPPPAPEGMTPEGMTPEGMAKAELEAKAEPAPVPPSAPAPLAPPAPVATPQPAPEPEPAPAAPQLSLKATAPAGQGYLVQLSAVRTEQAAELEWARLVKKNPDVLRGLAPVIQRADLGTKGIFYRVRGGWFTSRAEAKAICDELARRNVGCIIVKP